MTTVDMGYRPPSDIALTMSPNSFGHWTLFA